MTCLMLAAREGYCKAINLLVSHGAELDAQDAMGLTVKQAQAKTPFIFTGDYGDAFPCRTSHCFERTLATACV